MKKLIIISCIILIIGLILSAIGINSGAFELIDFQMYTEEFNAADISSIDLTNGYDDIIITSGDDDTLKVTYSCDLKRKNTITEKNGVLLIDSRVNFKWYDYIWNISSGSKTITVTLPKGWDSHLNINSNNSNISIENISGSFDIASTSGNLSLYSCVLSKFSAECSSGNILLSKTAVTDNTGNSIISNDSGNIRIEKSNLMNLMIDSKYGNITISSCNLESLTAENKIGNIYINTANIAKFANLKCSNGSINPNELTCPTFTAENKYGFIKFSKLTSDIINLSTEYGGINGEINGTESEYTIISNTNYGSNNLKNSIGVGTKTLTAGSERGNIIITFNK